MRLKILKQIRKRELLFRRLLSSTKMKKQARSLQILTWLERSILVCLMTQINQLIYTAHQSLMQVVAREKNHLENLKDQLQEKKIMKLMQVLTIFWILSRVQRNKVHKKLIELIIWALVKVRNITRCQMVYLSKMEKALKWDQILLKILRLCKLQWKIYRQYSKRLLLFYHLRQEK